MKVLEIFGEPIANGGQEAFVINVVKHIDDKDVQIDFLTPYYCSNETYRSTVEQRGGKIICLDLPFLPGKSRFNIAKPLKRFLKSNKYDVVHIHSGSISILAIASRVAKRCGVKKIIVHSHCAAEHKTLKYRLIKMYTSAVMNSCPTDYCACSLVAGEWKFSKRIVKNKLIILKNGVDLNEFSYNSDVRKELRSRFGFEDDTLVLGHVGRFSYQKNHEYLLKILVELKEIGVKCKLILIGSGELFDEIKEQTEKDEITDDIIFVGNVDDVANYMQAMDIFVLPSRFEGLPIVGVEAQAAGLPCVFSQAVTDEVKLTDAVKFLPADDASVADWCRTILDLSKEARQDNSVVLKEKGFDINKTAKKILTIYKK